MLSRLSRTLSKSTFLKNVGTVMLGTGAAQFIGFLASPLISRFFAPADFGLFGAFTSGANILCAAATLEYTQAVMLPKDDRSAFGLFTIALSFAVLSSVISGIVLAIWPGPLRLVSIDPLRFYSFLLALAVLAGAANQAFQAWCVRSKAFDRTSVSQVVRSIASNGLQLLFGFLLFGPVGLIVASLIGDFVASIPLFKPCLRAMRSHRGSLTFAGMKSLALEYRDFPAFAATQNLLNTVSQGLPIFLLSHFYGLSVAGAYAFGVRILQVPMGFVTRSLRQVLFHRACEVQHANQPLAGLYWKSTLGLLAICALPAAFLIITAPNLFTFVFGPKWQMAGEFARFLVFWLVFAFCNLPAVIFARLLRIQKMVFFYDVAMLAGRATSLVIGAKFFDPHITVALFSGVGGVMNLILILLVGNQVRSQANHSIEAVPAV